MFSIYLVLEHFIYSLKNAYYLLEPSFIIIPNKKYGKYMLLQMGPFEDH